MTHLWGQGETVEFTYFSLAHILPIAIMLVVIGLIILFRKQLRQCKHEDKIRLTLGFILIITEMTYFWRLVGVESLNASAVDHLPITVCGWAIIFSTFLVLTKNKTLYDIVYFWVFAGSLFGILTPTVITYCGPTRIRYYQFWLEHTLGFITIFYMTFVHGMRPNIKSMIKSYVLLLILGVIAIFTNLSIPGANYLFMAMPEDVPSILDILPKNYPLRITIMALAMALLFFIAYLPWFIIDKKRKKSNPGLTTENTDNISQKSAKKRNKDDIVIEDFKPRNKKMFKESKLSNTQPINPFKDQSNTTEDLKSTINTKDNKINNINESTLDTTESLDNDEDEKIASLFTNNTENEETKKIPNTSNLNNLMSKFNLKNTSSTNAQTPASLNSTENKTNTDIETEN